MSAAQPDPSQQLGRALALADELAGKVVVLNRVVLRLAAVVEQHHPGAAGQIVDEIAGLALPTSLSAGIRSSADRHANLTRLTLG